MADIGQIEQVLLNLATNARDAMPDGGLFIIETGQVEFDEEYVKTHGNGEPGMYAIISVTDTGIGLVWMKQQKKGYLNPSLRLKELGEVPDLDSQWHMGLSNSIMVI